MFSLHYYSRVHLDCACTTETWPSPSARLKTNWRIQLRVRTACQAVQCGRYTELLIQTMTEQSFLLSGDALGYILPMPLSNVQSASRCNANADFFFHLNI